MHLADKSKGGEGPCQHDPSNSDGGLLKTFEHLAGQQLAAFLRERGREDAQIPHLVMEILSQAVKQFPGWITQVALICHLTAKYRGDVHRYLARIIGDFQTADDLAQETFIRAMSIIRKGGQMPAEPTAKAWLFMIGINLFRDALRKNKARRECPLSGDHETTLIAKDECLDARLDLQETLSKLKKCSGCRTFGIAQLLQSGYSKEEIAEKRAVSKRTVERILRELAGSLKQYVEGKIKS
jgi:RNA polymerase sigma factor (sigma-70 family)